MKTYASCPKCRHAPLPDNQALPAACPACGLVLAKYAEIQANVREEATRIVRGRPLSEKPDEEGWIATLRDKIFHVPQRVDPSVFWARAALLIVFSIWGVRLVGMDFRDGEIGSSFLHRPLLIFHEAGHVIFRLFGEFMTIFGGTLGQLLMPAIMAGALLLKNDDPFGASIGVWLLGVSFLDVAPYVYDALDPQLMLLSGTTGEDGGHDWIYLLNATGMLKKAHGIGWFIHKLGATVIVLSVGWGASVLWRQHRVMKDAMQT